MRRETRNIYMNNVFDDELLSQEWCDEVFEGRNKAYGAYYIRSRAGRRYGVSLIVVMSICAIVFLMRLALWFIAYQAESGTFDGDLPDVELGKLKAQEGFEYKYIATGRNAPQPKAPEGEAMTVPEIVDTIIASQMTVGVDKDNDDAAPIEENVLADIPTDTVRMIVERDDLPIQDEPVFIPITEVPEMPQYPGGEKALMKYLDANIPYTAEHVRMRIEGEAEVAFIVDEGGSVRDAKMLATIQPDIDKAIVKAVEQMPKWKPGKVGGKPSKVRIRIPVRFDFR